MGASEKGRREKCGTISLSRAPLGEATRVSDHGQEKDLGRLFRQNAGRFSQRGTTCAPWTSPLGRGGGCTREETHEMEEPTRPRPANKRNCGSATLGCTHPHASRSPASTAHQPPTPGAPSCHPSWPACCCRSPLSEPTPAAACESQTQSGFRSVTEFGHHCLMTSDAESFCKWNCNTGITTNPVQGLSRKAKRRIVLI